MSKITVYDCAIDEEMNEAENFLKTGREILKMEIILLPHLIIISSDKPARYKPENEWLWLQHRFAGRVIVTR